MLPLAEIYAQAPAVFYAGVFILGLIVGSFLNVVIFRLPKMMIHNWREECFELVSQEQPALKLSAPEATKFNLVHPGSSCPHCQAAIRPWHNIPVISYLLLKGKCANCRGTIAARYPAVELVCGLLTLLPVYIYGPTWAGFFGMVLVWCLVSLTMIDIDHQLLPDSITLPLMWLGLLINLNAVYAPLADAVIGAAAGYLSLWSVYWLFKLVTGKEGMGYGDFKLLAALGAWMGWAYLPLIVILSSLVGAVIGLGAILVSGRDHAKPMPFGPYLAIAGLIAFFWGDLVLANYLQLFRI